MCAQLLSKLRFFRLTQPKLLFMLRLLELPDLPGVGEKPWGDTDLGTARQQFHEAGLALQTRGLVWLDENHKPVTDPNSTQLLSASAYPSQMTALAYKHYQGPVTRIYYYRRDKLDVRHTLLLEHIHEFQALPCSDMGRADD